VATITLLEDHKGQTAPKVAGDEYYVDALVDLGGSGNANYTTGGIDITAESLGLSRIISVMITGQDSVIAHPHIQINASGAYLLRDGTTTSKTSFCLQMVIGASGANAEGNGADYGSVRLRVYGIL
tara:strand:- start:179 stop:556 length:378 start_codon:yes stop_codon:yes gene_type:complete